LNLVCLGGSVNCPPAFYFVSLQLSLHEYVQNRFHFSLLDSLHIKHEHITKKQRTALLDEFNIYVSTYGSSTCLPLTSLDFSIEVIPPAAI
jgi:hypothetical protein